MTLEKTGGPAFPATIGPGGSEVQVAAEQWAFPGITVRDYFASKALHAFVRGSPNGTQFGSSHPATNETYARAAYAMADAMMKARDE